MNTREPLFRLSDVQAGFEMLRQQQVFWVFLKMGGKGWLDVFFPGVWRSWKKQHHLFSLITLTSTIQAIWRMSRRIVASARLPGLADAFQKPGYQCEFERNLPSWELTSPVPRHFWVDDFPFPVWWEMLPYLECGREKFLAGRKTTRAAKRRTWTLGALEGGGGAWMGFFQGTTLVTNKRSLKAGIQIRSTVVEREYSVNVQKYTDVSYFFSSTQLILVYEPIEVYRHYRQLACLCCKLKLLFPRFTPRCPKNGRWPVLVRLPFAGVFQHRFIYPL